MINVLQPIAHNIEMWVRSHGFIVAMVGIPFALSMLHTLLSASAREEELDTLKRFIRNYLIFEIIVWMGYYLW